MSKTKKGSVYNNITRENQIQKQNLTMLDVTYCNETNVQHLLKKPGSKGWYAYREREMRGKANHKNDYINNDTNLKRYSNSEYIVIVTNNCLKTWRPNFKSFHQLISSHFPVDSNLAMCMEMTLVNYQFTHVQL